VFQLEAVERGALAPLLRLLASSNMHVILAATAALRNISIHPRTEARLVQAGFLSPLLQLMATDRATGATAPRLGANGPGAAAGVARAGETDATTARMLLDIRCHAVSCLRNIVTSEVSKGALVGLGGVERLVAVLPDAPAPLQSEMAACLAVLALSEPVREHITKTAAVGLLIDLVGASDSADVRGNCAAALGNMAASAAACTQFALRWRDAATYLLSLAASGNPTFVYIAMWTLYHLAKHSTSVGVRGRDDRVLMPCAPTEESLRALAAASELVQAVSAATAHSDNDIAKLATKAQALLQPVATA
jgi:vacuolar protein 8